MSATAAAIPPVVDPARELVVSRVIPAAPARVYRAWTRHLVRWWGPHGMTTVACTMDLRPGGLFRTVMRAPDGTEYPTRGVFLELVEPERIVFTDAFDAGWTPNPALFFTAVATFEALPGNRTNYTARALHWTVESRICHERMGFHQGWGECLDRLARLLELHPELS